MFNRMLNPLKSRSFFLFGARGTGKSTFIKEHFLSDKVLYLDLLDADLESRLALNPQGLKSMIEAQSEEPSWVIVDEVQKVPKLLDVVHSLIESKKLKFILTGSSARKLKRGAANLLAGRAFVYNMYPLSRKELGDTFDLSDVLRWGSLPQVFSHSIEREKKAFLNAYVKTYFTEEIRIEQLVRKLDPFRAFLPVLGQVSGKIINHSKIADEIGSSTTTVLGYFQIVEDTLLGFYLPAFHDSARKSQRLSPKFYLFDNGVKKALEQSLDQVPAPRTSVFGELFESFIINEVVRLNSYCETDFRLSYFATKNDVEIDLILSKGKKHIPIEIKSSERIDQSEVKAFARTIKAIPNMPTGYYVSRDKVRERVDNVFCLHWEDFLNEFFP